MNNKVVPFLLGLAVGHFGLRWIWHGSYAVAIILAFEIGKHMA
jgi:hypothetical protein